MNPKVKELLTSICQSYRKNKSGTFFMAHGVYVTMNVSNQGMCIFPEIFREYTHSLIHIYISVTIVAGFSDYI